MADQENADLEERPEGTESPDKTDGAVSNKEAVDGAIEDAEPKTYSEEQFGGLLRDKQVAESNRQAAQADAAAAKEANEQLHRELVEAQRPQETELSEEDALEPITRGELVRSNKALVENITKVFSEQRKTDRAETLQQQRAQDVVNLKKTHTVKNMGQGLDARSVVDEGALYLRTNHPALFKAAMESPNAASELYKLSIAFVPEITKRAATKNNSVLATKLDESGETPPSGSAPAASEEEGLLEGILDGSVSEADLDAMVLSAQT